MNEAFRINGQSVLPQRPREPSGLVLLLIVVFMFFAILASYTICPMAHGQQTSQRTPAIVEAGTFSISSAFGESFPALKSGQILVLRHMYAAAIDPKAKQPVWVSYRVKRADWDTNNKLDRHFHTPPALRPVCLEPDDYSKSGYELGHMYGLQFVLAADHADEVNEMSVIAAQRGDLNKGPWLQAENRIKKASESQPVNVITGLLWLKRMPDLANADEQHKVASHCWMIFSPGPDGSEEAYLMPQTAARGDDCRKYAVDPVCLRESISDRWAIALEAKQ